MKPPPSPRLLKGEELALALRYAAALLRLPVFPNVGSIKGRGHAPRTAIYRRNPLLALLPFEAIAVNKHGATSNYIADAHLDCFRALLFNAGIALGTDGVYGSANHLVAPRRFAAAIACFTLTGKPLPQDAAAQARVSAKWQRYLNRQKRLNALVQQKLDEDLARVRSEMRAKEAAKRQRYLEPLPEAARTDLAAFFAHEQHPAPPDILRQKQASGLTWRQLRASIVAA